MLSWGSSQSFCLLGYFVVLGWIFTKSFLKYFLLEKEYLDKKEQCWEHWTFWDGKAFLKEKTVIPDPPSPQFWSREKDNRNSVTCLCTPLHTLIFVPPEAATKTSKSGLLTHSVPSEPLINSLSNSSSGEAWCLLQSACVTAKLLYY